MRMRLSIAVTLALALLTQPAWSGFRLLFWRHPQRRAALSTLPPLKLEISSLVSVSAKQKCPNWAWAAGVETILKKQGVEIPQNYWVMKADGGEVCKDELASLDDLAKIVNGVYVLEDGRKVRLEASTVAGAPTDLNVMVEGPRQGRPLILVWKGQPYVYKGMAYDDLLAPNGQHEYVVREVWLLDPFAKDAATQPVTFSREGDTPDDPATISGVMDIVATPIEGTNWLHPEQEVQHPTEIYFPK
jgi:hypothetical protein